ncbi:MAG TPA: hypothetical protein VFF98_07460 [Novosphingobium sp.]|nr:hypothetical protein [Novosphingobium sp.]HZV11218.1 hypothetical protein [Novosphingobium sp.]
MTNSFNRSVNRSIRTLALGGLLALGAGGVAQAHDAPYQAHLYGRAPSAGLHFADLEYAMPSDPLTWSSDPGWEAHHTPARFMTDAQSALAAAVPAGLSAAEAAQRLHMAGAHCRQPAGAELSCTYKTVETPRTYWDAVTWTVAMPLTADGRVASMSVTRDWTRRYL